MKKAITIKTQLIIFLACFAVFLAARDQDPSFILAELIAAASAAVCDAIFSFLKDKKLAVTESSLISGLIIGYVLASDNPWHVFVFASLAAICSKHLIRAAHRHIFNPAALGIFLSVVIFGAATQWKGTYLWYVLAPAGLYFTYRIRKLEVLAGYAVSSFALFGPQAVIEGRSLVSVFGYFSYFFIFIMLIEPLTSPARSSGKWIFGIGVGIAVFILTGMGVRFDAELVSLLILNFATLGLNKLHALR
ncbi:MAG: RnfABCDGE type electron transport complex subunit D [Candidatus Omnitrophica bacterium]|nr:RnfABCDGE type electron transport complex subunit D [Candidatus Omnitrophota bacterium]